MICLFVLAFVLSSPFQTVANFSVILVPRSGNAEFFHRSIFLELKKRGAQFSSEIQTYEYSYLNISEQHRATAISMNSQQERYSFARNSGLYVVPDSERSLSHLYLNGTEIHSYREGVDDDFCDSRPFTSVEFQRHLGRWLPLEIFDTHSDYTLLGLNVLLELLYRIYEEESERVQCEPTTWGGHTIYKWRLWTEPRKCSIVFGETLRLAYFFVSNENSTDYPTRIELHKRDEGDWKVTRKFRYLHFTPSFGEEQIVSVEPPARKACKRVDLNKN